MRFTWAKWSSLLITAAFLSGCAKPAFLAKENMAVTRKTEAQFLETATAIVDREISVAQTTLQSGANEEIKDLARNVVEKQTVLRDELTKISAARGMNLYRRSVRNSEAPAPVRGIERNFIETLTQDRKELIRELEFQFRDGHSSDIRNLAGNTLPILRQHMHVATQLWTAMQTAAISSEPAGGQSTGDLRNSPNPQ